MKFLILLSLIIFTIFLAIENFEKKQDLEFMLQESKNGNYINYGTIEKIASKNNIYIGG